MRISRRKGLVIAGIGLLVLSLLLLVTSSPFQQWLLRRAEIWAANAGFPFTARRLRLDLSELKASVEGLSYDQNGQRIRIERLDLDLPWSVLRGEGLRITNLEVDGVTVDIQPAEPSSGSTTTATTRSAPARLQIDRLVVRNASLSYSTPTMVVKLPSLSLETTNGRGTIRFDAPASVGPDTTVTLGEVPLVLSNESAQFGPAAWRIHYTAYESSGSAQGFVRWSPSVALETDLTTDPLTYEKWKDIRVRGKVSYADGTLSVSDFRANQGAGEIAGSAQLSGSGASTSITWKDLTLDPSGVIARTDGTLTLKSERSDFSDLSGEGQAIVNSREYGRIQAGIRITNANAALDLRANAMDLAIRAQINTGLEPLLKGNLREFRATVRGTAQPLPSGPLYGRLRPVNVSATGVFRGNVLTVRDIRAKSGNSSVSGNVQVNTASRSIRGTISQVLVDVHDLAPDASGAINLSGDIGGSLDKPTASFMASSSNLNVRNIPIDDVKVAGTLAPDSSGASELRATLSGTVHPLAAMTPAITPGGSFFQGFDSINISGEGIYRDNVVSLHGIQVQSRMSRLSDAAFQVNLSDKQVSGKIPGVQVDLSDVTPQAAGTVALAAEIGGTLDQPTASFTGSSSGLDIGGTHIDSVGLEGTFADNSFNVTRLEARQSEGVLNAKGSANLTTEAIDAEAKVSDLSIVQMADLSAHAFLDARIDGTYKTPNINFSGEFRNVVYRQEEHGDIHFKGATNLKTATVLANSVKYSASVTGEATLEAPYAFTAGLESTKSSIAYGKYNLVADGKVRLSGEAQPFKANHLEFDAFRLRGEGIELLADGPVNPGARVDLKVNLPELPIDGVNLEGTAQVLATISGSLDDPSIEGALTTDGARVRVMQMSEPAEVSAQVDFTGRDFSIRTLQAGFAGATATITGKGSWQGEGQLQFRIDNLRPENFAKGQPVSGLAGIEGYLDIRSPSLEGISGNVKVTQLDLAVRQSMIRQTRPIEAELRNQVLTVKSFEIEGLDTHASITGHANLMDRTLHFDADADTDLAILAPFIPNSSPAGRIETRVALRGTPDKPLLDGFVNISGGELDIRTPAIELSKMDVQAQLHGDRIELTRATGVINGGTFEASGGTAVSASGLGDTSLRVNVQRAQLEYPEGLHSEISSELRIDGSMPNLTLSGSVDVLNAIYQKDINLTQQLFAQITSPAQTLGTAPGIGDQIRMEIDVRTPGPILVTNNVADLEAAGTFRVRGTVANPILLGRALVTEGGELYFGPTVSAQAVETSRRSDRYTIERGSIDFNNPLRTEPELDFRATHELEVEDERYLITLEVTGTPETLKAELTSDPHMEQSDIVFMLLTGRTLHELQGTYANFAGEQALGYLSGRLTEQFLNQAGAVFGLNTVRIDPVTVAGQTDLAARLTLAKDFTREFSLIYSQYLNSAEAQTWIASYKPFRNFVLRGINDAEQNEVLVDLKHDIRFGAGTDWLKRTRPENETTLRDVTFTGSRLPEKDLRKHVTSEGSPFGFYRVSQDVRNLRRFLASQGYPSARIQTQQSTTDRSVDVHFEIDEGPRIVFAYEGANVPESLQREIQQIWTLRSSNNASILDSTTRLLRHFRSEGYLQATISVDTPPASSGDRRYVFKITTGDKFEKPTWVFKGVEPIAIQDPAGLILENPEAIKARIESHFRTNAYLDVESDLPMLVIDGDKARFEVTVVQGRAYSVESIEFEGNKALDSQQLRDIATRATKSSGTPEVTEEAMALFTPTWLENARQNITSEYWKRGYNDVQIVPSTTRDPKLAHVVARFEITEGDPQFVEAIEITGANLTNRAYIQRQFQFKKGDPVDLTKINLTRKKLYDTGVFRRVEIEMVPGTSGYIARVHLTETAPWQLRYGLSVTEHLETGDRSVGVSTDLAYHNLLGKGITAGISGKLNTDERDGRVFGSMPHFFGRKVTSSLTFFRTRDLSNPDDVVDYWGTTIQQQWRIRERYLLSYDYSFRKVLRGARTTDLDLDDEDTILDDPRVPLARFGVVLSRDTRDDILNATRGSFMSNSFEVAPPGIGSSIEFYRNFSQYLRFQPVKKFVFASAIRFGIVKPMNDDILDPTLQFSAGGSTTVRAFKQDGLTHNPGNYELILNQEFRFPLFWKFSAVTFLDVGQVALRSRNLFDFRYGPGVGIRIQTPFVILRTDLGINVWRRPLADGTLEDRGRWSFGIGQAF